MSQARVPHVCCSFCGAALVPKPGPLALGFPVVKPVLWYSWVRAVFVDREASSTASISARGEIIQGSVLLASLDIDNPDVPHDELSRIKLFQNDGRYWGYGFHDACWQLLLAKLSPSGIVDRVTIAQSLFQLFYATECPDFARFSFAHDYGGVQKMESTFPLQFTYAYTSLEAADPLLLPSASDFAQYASTILNVEGLNRSSQTSSATEQPAANLIQRLPLEISYLIIELLPVADVANLRLTCRHFSQLTEMRSLTQQFWRNRFMPGFELDYIFPDAVPNTDDYFQLFCGVIAHIKNKHKPFANKKRIWNLLEHIVYPVKLTAMESRSLYGQPVVAEGSEKNIYRLRDNDTKEPSDYLISERSFGGLVTLENHENQITEGCRLSHRVAASFKSEAPDGILVEVSTVTLGGRSYISGFGCISPQEHGHDESRAGFSQRGGQQLLQFPTNIQIEYIEVAFCTTGLTGLRFLCTENYKSPWVGENQGSGIACGAIKLNKDNRYNFVVGLDEYKIVSLSSVKSHGSIPNARNVPHEEVEDGKEIYLQSRLWTPHRPQHSDMTFGPLIPEILPGSFEPLLNMDFGGPGGVLLGSLTSITVHMVPSSFPVVGMTFTYGDSRKVFGHPGAVELTALINGPEGERIVGFAVMADDWGTKISGLRIKTNRRRLVDFAPLPPRYLSSSLKRYWQLLDSQLIWDRLTTGFVVASSRGKISGYRKLGVQCQPGQPPNQLEYFQSVEDQDLDDTLQADLDASIDHLTSTYISSGVSCDRNKGFATRALMIGIRKIQVSTGRVGTSRSRLHVSGLRFDYHEACRPPTVVGQWITPQESWEIAPGEDIVKLTVWYFRQLPFEDALQGSYKGTVAAVRFETSNGRSRSFSHTRSKSFTGRVHGITLDLNQTEFQPNFCETMIGISWVLNRKFDNIRGIMRTNRRVPDNLIPGLNLPQAHKIYFDVNHLDRGDRLSRITAHRLPDRNSITGFTFVYDSKIQRTIGYTSDYKCQSIDIVPETKIVELSTRVVASQLITLELTLRPEPSDDHRKLYRNTIKDKEFDESKIQPSRITQFIWRAFSSGETKTTPPLTMGPSHPPHPPFSPFSPYPMGQHRVRGYDAPEDMELVGFYIGCHNIHEIGAIYERETPVNFASI